MGIFCFGTVLAMQPKPKQEMRSEDGLINKGDRILILAPHPDDEAIACAGVIQEAVRKGAEVRIAYLTNGDHNQISFIVFEKRLTLFKGEFIHMGEVRMSEAKKAMKLLGLSQDKLAFLGYPDFGTFTIFRNYWSGSRSYKSLLTHISRVPYKTNLSFNSSYTGENILRDLKTILTIYKPNKVFVSHPADVNVDHKSLYLFLEVALADLENEISAPKVYPYLVHCTGWPLPRHYHPELNLEPPQKFLDAQIGWIKPDLTAEELENKHQAILAYRSQTESSAFYLLAFARKNELFGNYSDVDLSVKVPESAQDKISYTLDNNSLLIHINKPKKAANHLSTLSYLFGYSYKKPFAQMPKILIAARFNKVKLFDGPRKVNPEGVKLDSFAQDLVLTVPLKILGDPDFLLASVKADAGPSSVYFSGFRKIIIRKKSG